MKKKRDKTTISLFVVLFAGLSLLLYPTVSDYWNSLHASRAITDYESQVIEIDDEKYRDIWQSAIDYNKSLLDRRNSYILSDKQKQQYEKQLNISGNGIMGYIEIPVIKTTIPVYHGTEDSVLQIAVGHLEWTSLPVGGESTHCVLSGHRGLPSAKLFTDLDKVTVGDTFILRVLDEALTYEVDQILIVEPDDIDALYTEEGKDLCTLVTCTPYGINTHRLLVRGHRIEGTTTLNVRVSADAVQISPMTIAPLIAVPLLLLILLAFLITDSRRRKKKK